MCSICCRLYTSYKSRLTRIDGSDTINGNIIVLSMKIKNVTLKIRHINLYYVYISNYDSNSFLTNDLYYGIKQILTNCTLLGKHCVVKELQTDIIT